MPFALPGVILLFQRMTCVRSAEAATTELLTCCFLSEGFALYLDAQSSDAPRTPQIKSCLISSKLRFISVRDNGSPRSEQQSAEKNVTQTLQHRFYPNFRGRSSNACVQYRAHAPKQLRDEIMPKPPFPNTHGRLTAMTPQRAGRERAGTAKARVG